MIIWLIVISTFAVVGQHNVVIRLVEADADLNPCIIIVNRHENTFSSTHASWGAIFL